MINAEKLIADELRGLRAKKDLSLEETAKISGISIDTICRYENNMVSMKIGTIEKLLSTYGEDFDIFFKKIYANKHNKIE